MIREKVSVIIPAYNSGKTIGQCLRSIYSSTYIPDEVIVLDDSSQDSTVEIVKQFDCALIRNKTRLFQAAGRNIGAKKSKGDLLLFMDSDIELKKDSIELVLLSIIKAKASAVCGVYDEFNPYNNIFSQYKHLSMVFNQMGSKIWIKYPNTSFLLIWKDAFLASAGFCEQFTTSEDLDFGHLLARNGHKIFFDKNIKVIHNKYLDIRGFIKRDYKTAKEITLIALKNLFLGIITEWPVRLSFRISFFLVPLLYLSLFYTFFPGHNNKPFFFLFILCFILNIKFISFLYRRKGLVFALSSFFILLLHITICLAGTITGILKFLFMLS